MRTATIRGHVTATSKHQSLTGWRLLIAVPDSPDLAPQVVIDNLGAGIGQRVMISSDGSESRKMVGDERSPARWHVLGIIDPERSHAS
ncbi:MAG: EutN/CcmL family microcompartment protein [Verrucomicrobia bacterium]|nr:EutN/CcmL family microcompartment protein [Verrucomicrobiota bacterium]